MGCSETSNPGCKICYAIHRHLPQYHDLHPGSLRRTSAAAWREPLRWQKELEQKGEVESVFISLTDFFHPRANEWRAEAWDILRNTPNLQWIILTQRIANAAHQLPPDWGDGFPNVWLGISASDQQHADQRIPKLLSIPAARHVLSLEPLREKITLSEEWLSGLDWVITGGASGDDWQQWRLYPAWVRSLRDQCTAAEIPFFFKQLGGPAYAYRDGDQAVLDGQLWQQIPTATCQARDLSLLPQQGRLI